MRWLQAQPNGARIVVVGLAVLQSLALAGCERDEPIYYVDGARPSPGANSGVATEGQPPAGCVPWSSERRDVYVCGPVPDSFEPAPPPGDILDYPAVCDIGAAIFRKEAEALMVRNAFQRSPSSTSQVAGPRGLVAHRKATGWQSSRWPIQRTSVRTVVSFFATSRWTEAVTSD
jgi:hypothetical protein